MDWYSGELHKELLDHCVSRKKKSAEAKKEIWKILQRWQHLSYDLKKN